MTPGRGKLAQESGCPHNRAAQVTSVYRPNMLEPHEWASPLSPHSPDNALSFGAACAIQI